MSTQELAQEIANLTPVELDGLMADLGMPLKAAIHTPDLDAVAATMLEVYSPGDALAQIERRMTEQS